MARTTKRSRGRSRDRKLVAGQERHAVRHTAKKAGIKRKAAKRTAKTYDQMVKEAIGEVPTISPAEARRRMQQDPRTLVIDVRDAADINATGTIPDAMNISLGTLTYKADNEVDESWREPALRDRARPIITVCEMGPMGALGGKLLRDMGFENVSILEGGTQAWKDAGFPTKQV
jgi:rhodanese-related sulfurtransferase